MGTLNLGGLPERALLLLDPAPIIDWLEDHPTLAARFEPVFQGHASGRFRVAVTAVTIADVLTGPFKAGDEALAQRYRALQESSDGAAVTAEIAENAARLRAGLGLKLADAVLAASALSMILRRPIAHPRCRIPPIPPQPSEPPCAPTFLISPNPSKPRSGFCGGVFDWDRAIVRFDELTARSEAPGFWDDPQAAQKMMRERNKLEAGIAAIRSLETELKDTVELAEMADAEGDAGMLEEAAAALRAAQKKAAAAELEALLSGEADGNDCYVEINSGAGGTESQDWALMLMRMYARWANAHGMRVEEQDYQDGDTAGIKSATLLVKGENAYGWMKTEAGVHRLVRISPFDSNARRHTSFASVWVYPVIDDTIEIEINESDCRVDTFRASGAGGQHVNKTDSAIRITHIPTGIVVACQAERSQHKNRAQAWDMLRARLYEAELQKREAAQQALEDTKTEIGWGRQIRSYVLQPYQMVKDLRTGVETSDTAGVLDGDLDAFMAAALAQRLGGEPAGEVRDID
jgi:peptide chain release factor 2